MTPRLSILHAATQQFRDLLPDTRITQTRNLTLFISGMLWSRSVALPRVAAALPLSATTPSLERRLQRWLANVRVDVAATWHQLLPVLVADQQHRELILVFDPTPLGQRYTVLVLGMVVRHRVMPLAWRIVPQQEGKWEVSQKDLMVVMMREVQAALPSTCTVTLVADRQMSGVDTLDACAALDWHVVVRLNGGLKRKITWRDGPDAPMQTVADLITGPGQRWQGRGQIFLTKGGRDVVLTIRWDRGCDEPWLLLADLDDSATVVAAYRRRARCESTYQDCKSRHFQVHRSKVTRRDRLDRLFLALHLAFWWGIRLGLQVLRTGKRRHHDRADRRDLSLLRLGSQTFIDLGISRHRVALLFSQRGTAWVVPGMT